MRVLTATAGLLLENFFTGRRLRNRLAVKRTCGLPTFASTPNSRFHAIDDNLEVQLAMPADDCLAGFLVRRNIKRRIFLRQTFPAPHPAYPDRRASWAPLLPE